MEIAPLPSPRDPGPAAEPAHTREGDRGLSLVPPAAPTPTGPWGRAKHLVVHRILHLDDTPHRIALGVFLGFLVGATPTIGVQMVIYFGIAALVGANKLSGIPPIWLSNPVTAVPLYYGNWKVGTWVMTGNFAAPSAGKEAIQQMIAGVAGSELSFFERLVSREFWSSALDTFMTMGVELWVGSLVVGVVSGALAYWATYRGVIGFRHKLAEHRSSHLH